MAMTKSTAYYDVHWEGPFAFDNLPQSDPCHVLYLICGTHGLYGKDVPLYLGITEQGSATRMAQHARWVEDEPDPVKVYFASIGVFESWETNEQKESYPAPSDRRVTESIESLLIYSHQPVYNRRSTRGGFKLDCPYVVFNTGHRGSLYPEVSSLRWLES